MVPLAGASAIGLGALMCQGGGQAIATGHPAAIAGGSVFVVAGSISIIVGVDLMEGNGIDKTLEVINSIFGRD
jgi:hypothetical protein